jgi:hypothetical protein
MADERDRATPPRPACPACASRDVKLYPDDFGRGEPFAHPLVTGPLALIGGIGRPKPVLVCTACGHNFEPAP